MTEKSSVNSPQFAGLLEPCAASSPIPYPLSRWGTIITPVEAMRRLHDAWPAKPHAETGLDQDRCRLHPGSQSIKSLAVTSRSPHALHSNVFNAASISISAPHRLMSGSIGSAAMWLHFLQVAIRT